MGHRRFNLSVNKYVLPCPKCGQNTRFTAHSTQVAEDCCDVWIVCICGHDPHKPGCRLEDVWGSLDADTIHDAIGCWNDAVASSETEPTEVGTPT